MRKQKTDKRDAAHILRLVMEDRFPKLWTPDREQRDLRQLLLHRHKLVEIRSRVKNELQHLSLNKGTDGTDPNFLRKELGCVPSVPALLCHSNCHIVPHSFAKSANEWATPRLRAPPASRDARS